MFSSLQCLPQGVVTPIYAVVTAMVVGQKFGPSTSALDLYTAPKLTADRLTNAHTTAVHYAAITESTI